MYALGPRWRSERPSFNVKIVHWIRRRFVIGVAVDLGTRGFPS